MSEIETQPKVETEEETTEGEEGEEGEEEGKPEPKPKLTKEQQLGIHRRQVTKLEKELGIAKEEPKVEVPKKVENKKGFDRIDVLTLKTYGVNKEDFPLVEEYVQNTGKPIEDILELKVFQAELKERKEARETKEATPSGTKRSSSASKTNIDYWISKGELPPKDQPKLRQAVVNERMEREKSSGQH